MDLDLARWQWNDDSLTGVDEIDADHRHFGLLVGDLERVVAAGADESVVGAHMRAIAHDALAHFDREDRLLTRHGYPKRDHHAGLHNEIRTLLNAAATNTHMFLDMAHPT